VGGAEGGEGFNFTALPVCFWSLPLFRVATALRFPASARASPIWSCKRLHHYQTASAWIRDGWSKVEQQWSSRVPSASMRLPARAGQCVPLCGWQRITPHVVAVQFDQVLAGAERGIGGLPKKASRLGRGQGICSVGY